jgi:hypothetical protein
LIIQGFSIGAITYFSNNLFWVITSSLPVDWVIAGFNADLVGI